MFNQKKLHSIVLSIVLIFVHSFGILPSTGSTNLVTLKPIASKSVSQATISNESYLMVMSIEYGIKSFVYIAFDLSELPENVIPTAAIFRIKNEAISYSCWISAFCSPNADWVETSMTWDTKPEFGKYIDAGYIGTMSEWYSWRSDSLVETIIESLKTTNRLTIALKTGVKNTDQYGLVTFYPDAQLVITYTLDTNAPTLSNFCTQPANPTPNDEVTVSVTITDNESGVKEAYLYYSTDGGVNWAKVLMSSIKNSDYEAIIPQQSEGTTVQYYIEAFDNALNNCRSDTFSYTVQVPRGDEQLWILILMVGIIIIGVLIFHFTRKRR